MRSDLAAWARRVLGRRCAVVADRSWGHDGACVLELRDADGVTWFAKRHRDREPYQRELTAYRRWVPALGGRAPTLRGYDDGLRVLLLSAVAGEAGLSHAADPRLHHRAGTLLRLLHEAEALPPWTDLVAEKLDELDRLSVPAGGLFDRRELDFVRAGLRDLAGVPAPPRVPCHLDFSPRNWLVSQRRVHVIDFEWAGPEVWVNDLNRLYFGFWRDRPDLRDAFLVGYGRTIDATDQAVLHACGSLTSVFIVLRARARGDAAFEEVWRQNLRRLMDGWR